MITVVLKKRKIIKKNKEKPLLILCLGGVYSIIYLKE